VLFTSLPKNGKKFPGCDSVPGAQPGSGGTRQYVDLAVLQRGQVDDLSIVNAVILNVEQLKLTPPGA
jgi:hypothetical protein